jgi:hypothetical protein
MTATSKHSVIPGNKKTCDFELAMVQVGALMGLIVRIDQLQPPVTSTKRTSVET